MTDFVNKDWYYSVNMPVKTSIGLYVIDFFYFFYWFVVCLSFVFKVVTYYNQLPEFDEKMPCKDFELNVTIEESSSNSPSHYMSYTFLFLFLVIHIRLIVV